MTTNLKDVKAGYGLTSTINSNNDTIASELDTKLSRTLAGFNNMEVPLDMGNNAIVNLPEAVSEASPVTLGQAAEIAGVENPLTSESVGAVLYPQTAAETAAGVTPGYLFYEPGDVRRYGATGDGITDDSAAFQAALDQNVQSGGATIRSYYGPYLINTTLTWCKNGENYKDWKAENTRLQTDQDITILDIGMSGVDDENFQINIYGLIDVKSLLGVGVSTKAGIMLRQLYSCEMTLGVSNFRVGIHCQTDTIGGFVYNTINLRNIYNNYYGVWLDPQGTGWVNENTFHGGRFWNSSSGTFGSHVYMPNSGQTYGKPNNNCFFRPSLEGNGTMDTLYLDGGRYNMLFQPRLEFKGTLTDESVVFTSDSRGCSMTGGYDSRLGRNLNGIRNETVRDEGQGNNLMPLDQWRLTPSRSGAAGECISVFRTQANNDELPVMGLRDMYSSSQSPRVIETVMTKYRTAGAAYHLSAKASGDIVSGTSGMYYQCLQDHASSTADSEPGVGADWEDYWEALHGIDANKVYRYAGTDPWSASYGTYLGKTTTFEIRGDGRLLTNQTASSTSTTVGAAADYMTIYDEAGTAVGEIPICAVGTFST